ncbi:RagB/SusD family nutrient uptake outer membrane protein [Aquimarina mytili]|uniref:RagB/SusD family nutrient uptake outer membrane protein n=1 Tax=Aquimarina mytili TaxID=874423 RepID=A0A937A3V3_9FLAO|nr:RagB/SusD family nutrient uptake outer membrane protein [Aquimarina mytili]MBL0684455.1 RagB/SusD family nutrient uptake outer membrane protein [Aquimarina mytili]
MKNNKIKSYIALFLLTIVSMSCENYLEEAPDNRLELDTVDKAAKVAADAYTQASYVFTDMYTDLAGPTGNPDALGVVQTPGGNTINLQATQTYTWSDITALFQDSPTFYWDRSYAAIAQANQVLAVIDMLEGDQKQKNAIKGEALLSRAYHHFMLVNLFGLHYDENASSNLGIPYVLEPEIEFLPDYTRNTVAEVYDQVEEDLLDGLALINDEFFSGTKKYHFTTKAAQAFASRFYLWKKDYVNCKKYSDLFLDGNPDFYIKDFSTLSGAGYNDTAEKYGDPIDPSNVLVMQQFTFYTRRNNGYRLNATDVNNLYRNLFAVTDNRTSIGGWTVGTDARYQARLREYFFRENLSSNTGQAYYISQELKGEEVLLNRAEANLFLGDQAAALADINVLATKRYNGTTYDNITDIVDYYTPLTTSGSVSELSNDNKAILELILDERKKEFWDHGLRWFDVKRHGISITHVLPVSEGGQTFVLEANDLRKAIQIPEDALSFGLTRNPR